MKRSTLAGYAPAILAVAVLAVATLAGGPVYADAGAGLLLLGQVAAVPANAMPPFRRIREFVAAFDNVVANGRASTEIPRNALTLLRCSLRLGGTAFTKAMITEIRLRLGAKTIWEAVGSELNTIRKYLSFIERDNFLTIDFTQPRDKTIGGEMLGGIDMTKLPPGKLLLEVVIAGATAPTLDGIITWGPPQANAVVQRLRRFTWSSGTGTGERRVPLELDGERLARLYLIYAAGADIGGAVATAAALATNTGDGVMGAITASAGAKVGAHQIVVVEPGAGVGTFIHKDPDGMIVGKGAVASDYSGGGLAFTLADGGTDFAAGDGFTITVPANANGNLSRVRLRKDRRDIWDMECRDARFLAQEYGRSPQSRLYVVDLIADNNIDAVLNTADAKQLELDVWLTAADNLIIYAETLGVAPRN